MIMHRLSVRDLKRKMDAGQALLIIDVREGFCDSDRMIPGAIHIDARDLNPHLFNLGHDVEVVVYGNRDQDDATVKVADALQAAGFCAESLQGGWHAWLDSGFPTEERQERALPRHPAELNARVQEAEPATANEPTSSDIGSRSTGGVSEEARERVRETAEGATHALGDLAGRALRLVQALIRR
jgi:rhodanese-related sulfurtransferase